MRALNNIQSIALAVIVFMLLHFSLTVGMNYFSNKNPENFMVWLQWLNLVAYLLYVLSGFIAGALSRKKQIIVGLVAGLVSALAAILFGVGGGSLYGALLTLTPGLVLGSVGGSLSLLLFKSRVKNGL